MEKKESKTRTTFTIPPELLAAARKAAAAERRNFSNWLCTLIEDALKKGKK